MFLAGVESGDPVLFFLARECFVPGSAGCIRHGCGVGGVVANGWEGKKPRKSGDLFLILTQTAFSSNVRSITKKHVAAVVANKGLNSQYRSN